VQDLLHQFSRAARSSSHSEERHRVPHIPDLTTPPQTSTIQTTLEEPPRPSAHTLEGACEQLGHIGRSTLYGLIAQGRLEAVKLGSRTLITDASITALLGSLPRVKGKPGSRRAGGGR
jgi:excisionase family DNA binding protein